jgi:hypothetical protein
MVSGPDNAADGRFSAARCDERREIEWNPWVKFSQSVQKNALVVGFVSSSAQFFMTGSQMQPEAE